MAVTVGPNVPDTTQCYRPPTVGHAEVSLYADWNGVVAIYNCHVGYYFAAGGTVRTIYCTENDWSLEVTDCERT